MWLGTCDEEAVSDCPDGPGTLSPAFLREAEGEWREKGGGGTKVEAENGVVQAQATGRWEPPAAERERPEQIVPQRPLQGARHLDFRPMKQLMLMLNIWPQSRVPRPPV